MDVRERVMNTLLPLVPGEWVKPEDLMPSAGKMPEEYITFSVTDDRDVSFADNSPVLSRQFIGLNFVTTDIDRKLSMPRTIKRAMLDAGFYCHNTQADIPREDNSRYYGIAAVYSWLGGAYE